MKTSLLVALSFSLVACGGALEGDDLVAQSEQSLGYVSPPTDSNRKPRVKVARLTEDAVAAMQHAEVVELAPGAIEALANQPEVEVTKLSRTAIESVRSEPSQQRVEPVVILSVAAIKAMPSSDATLFVSTSQPMSAEAMTQALGVEQFNLSCATVVLSSTEYSLTCEREGRALSQRQVESFVELLVISNFVN
ncbi:MAG: hypothetical protein ACO1OB_27230 [Archangium sp.]